ncbi:MAG: 50S ribosomal protein L13 [Phycisphaerae bacterium]|nr:50S ribosomal protein L13 [Phycisphaerae bacterium]
MALHTKTTLLTPQTAERNWLHVDATDQVLGRLATRIATYLMGKHKATYTPHVDTGDFVVVTNCSKLRITGHKLEQREHQRFSEYPSGLKRIPWAKVYRERPERLLQIAVKRMLPKNGMGNRLLSKLKLYRGADHPHQAQHPVSVVN